MRQIRLAFSYQELVQLGRRFLEWVGFQKKVNPEFDYNERTLAEYLVDNGEPFSRWKEIWEIIKQPEYTADIAIV